MDILLKVLKKMLQSECEGSDVVFKKKMLENLFVQEKRQM